MRLVILVGEHRPHQRRDHEAQAERAEGADEGPVATRALHRGPRDPGDTAGRDEACHGGVRRGRGVEIADLLRDDRQHQGKRMARRHIPQVLSIPPFQVRRPPWVLQVAKPAVVVPTMPLREEHARPRAQLRVPDASLVARRAPRAVGGPLPRLEERRRDPVTHTACRCLGPMSALLAVCEEPSHNMGWPPQLLRRIHGRRGVPQWAHLVRQT
mmetsp:Transcript_20669/g.59841  ORF Transcript_20669/g.59841 Transcript_20669/m.59841 type:complete len:213 (-) Transcript_20669:292-930(-)